jgi:uncharacterized membrane protein YkvA (DUF1232 family)
MPVTATKALSDQITTHVQAVGEALRTNEFIDLTLAKAIASVLQTILAEYSSYPQAHQILIVGAVRYFIHDGDANRDTASVLGFDDDAAVLNYVLEVINRPDLKVEV